jgi:hypothetical protein
VIVLKQNNVICTLLTLQHSEMVMNSLLNFLNELGMYKQQGYQFFLSNYDRCIFYLKCFRCMTGPAEVRHHEGAGLQANVSASKPGAHCTNFQVG